MKTIKKFIFPVLLVGLTFVCFCFLVRAGQLVKELPDAVVFRMTSGLDYSFDELVNAEIPKGLVYSGASFSNDYLSINPLLGENVSVVKTDDGYQKILKPEMIRGGWFSTSYVPEGNKVAVISDSLAVKLFLSDATAVGKTISLSNGEEYTICGVYKDGNSFAQRISSNGKSEIFIPWKQGHDSLKPQLLYVMGNSSKFSQSIDDELKKTFGRQLYYESRSDYREAHVLAEQAIKGTIFFCGALVVILLCIAGLKNGKRAFNLFVGEEKKQGYKYAVITVGFFVAMLVVLLLSVFKLEIPSSYLPYDNIFDFKHYINSFVVELQKHNSSTIFDYYWCLSQNVLIFSLLWGAATVIMFYFTCFYNLRYIAKWLWQVEE